MSENSTLRIHTQFRPETTDSGQSKLPRQRRHRPKKQNSPMTRGDRLLRNSAIACALLLGILALGNLRAPWAEKASESIERALSMHINLDDSIGELTFVRQIMPESALVFLNVSGSNALARPCDGAIVHAWSELQPWLSFESGKRPVCAVDGGIVTAVSTLSGGNQGLLVDHGEGRETLYANLSEVTLQAGDRVARGQQLGACEDGLYFEFRQNGESVNPAEGLGL